MFPRVREVVLIVERVQGIGQQFIERAFAFVDGQGVVELEAWVRERLVFEGELVQPGYLLADCSASKGGELSLGQNILIAYIFL